MEGFRKTAALGMAARAFPSPVANGGANPFYDFCRVCSSYLLCLQNMNAIRKFFGGRTITEELPMPQPAFDREAHLISELHSIDQMREELADSIRTFRKQHTLMRDGQLCYQTDVITARQELDSVWNALLNTDGKLL